MKTKRRTGRTNRMIKEVMFLADMNMRVCAIALDQNDKDRLIGLLGVDYSHKVDVLTASHVENSGFDWQNPEDWQRKSHYDSYAIDHNVIESRFKLMLEELHYYDLNEEES